MVSPIDYDYLEPQLEDILSVWVLELTQQNLDKVRLPIRSPSGKICLIRQEQLTKVGLRFLEESKLNQSIEVIREPKKGHQEGLPPPTKAKEQFLSEATETQVIPTISLENSKNVGFTRGIEDIVNFMQPTHK